MGVRYTAHDDLGDGRYRVFGRTDQGVAVDVVIDRHHFGGAVMWQVLEAAGVKADKLRGSQTARVGRVDSEE